MSPTHYISGFRQPPPGHAVHNGEFACSMLIARRLYQHAPDHKLGTLVNTLNIENDGTFHRALADAEMTAKLWLRLVDEVKQQTNRTSISFEVMQKLTKTSKAAIPAQLRKLSV